MSRPCNTAFRWKMLLLACALIISGLAFWPATHHGIARVNMRKALAVLAFLLWLAVGISGRLIGFL